MLKEIIKTESCVILKMCVKDNIINLKKKILSRCLIILYIFSF